MLKEHMDTTKLEILWLSIIFGFIGLVLALVCYRLNNSEDFYFYGQMPRTSYKSIPMVECAWCHTQKKLNRHHVVPQSANPKLRDEYTNIVVLCRACHEVLGHRRNWKRFNPDVLEIVTTYTNCVWSKDYFNGLEEK